MSPAARTVVSMQLSQASKLCHRRAAAWPLSRTSDVQVWQLAPPTASSSVLLTTSQRQTMSTRSSSIKRCLPNASSSVDHVPPSAFLCGVKGHTWNYCAEEGEPGDEAKLNLPTVKTELLQIKTFGSTKSDDTSCDVVQVGIETRDDGTLSITALVVPFICNPLTTQPIIFGVWSWRTLLIHRTPWKLTF